MIVLSYVLIIVIICFVIGCLVNWVWETGDYECPYIKWKDFVTLYKKSNPNNWDLYDNTVYYKGVGFFYFYPIGYYKYKIMKYRIDKKVANKKNNSQYNRLIKAVQYDYEERNKL